MDMEFESFKIPNINSKNLFKFELQSKYYPNEKISETFVKN